MKEDLIEQIEHYSIILDDYINKRFKYTLDTEYLEALITKFNGGPVGASTVATSIGEEVTTIEDVVEPYLLQEGFIKRTPRGRVACEKAYKHLNIEYEPNK